MDKEILQVAQEFREGLLSGKPSVAMCFITSSALAGYLQFAEYQCEVTKGNIGSCEHYWITFPDGNILDATADQFLTPNGERLPSVYYGSKPRWYKS